MTYEDNLRLGGEVISVLGAFVILLLEVSHYNTFTFRFDSPLINSTISTFYKTMIINKLRKFIHILMTKCKAVGVKRTNNGCLEKWYLRLILKDLWV